MVGIRGSGDRPSKERARLSVILLIYALFGLGYSLLVPLWEAADESEHYQVALYIAREGKLPPRSLNIEAAQPPLYYWLASWPLRLLDRIDPAGVELERAPRRPRRSIPYFDLNQENYRFLLGPQLLRWLNILLGGVSALLIYSAARTLERHDTLALAAAALAALLPQLLHVCASINNDPLALLAGSVLFFMLVRLCAEQFRWRDVVWLAGAAVLLPALTKLTVAPVSLACLAAVLWKLRLRLGGWRTAWIAAAFLLVSAATFALLQLMAPQDERSLTAQVFARLTHVRPRALHSIGQSALAFIWSYFGVVAWQAVGVPGLGLPPALVESLSAAFGLGLAGSLLRLAPQHPTPGRAQRTIAGSAIAAALIAGVLMDSWLSALWAAIGIGLFTRALLTPVASTVPREVWAFAWLALALGVAGVLKNLIATPWGVQGRHILPSTGPIALLVATGWLALLPGRLARLLPVIIVTTLAASSLYFAATALVPVYFQPFLD